MSLLGIGILIENLRFVNERRILWHIGSQGGKGLGKNRGYGQRTT